MKDLNLNRMINVVAVGGLMLTVSGCGSSPGRASKQVCKAFRECAKADFEEEYGGDLEDCVEEYEDIFDALEDVSDDCAKAGAKFMTCSAKAYRADCDIDDVEDDCEDQAEDFADECYDGQYSDYY